MGCCFNFVLGIVRTKCLPMGNRLVLLIGIDRILLDCTQFRSEFCMIFFLFHYQQYRSYPDLYKIFPELLWLSTFFFWVPMILSWSCLWGRAHPVLVLPIGMGRGILIRWPYHLLLLDVVLERGSGGYPGQVTLPLPRIGVVLGERGGAVC